MLVQMHADNARGVIALIRVGSCLGALGSRHAPVSRQLRGPALAAQDHSVATKVRRSANTIAVSAPPQYSSSLS